MASVWLWSRILLFLISSQTGILVEAECYFPGGSLATEHHPCDPSAATTLCCPSGWTCSRDAKCVVAVEGALASALPLGTASRGTCTDAEWDEIACGNFYLGDPILQDDESLGTCSGENECSRRSAAEGKAKAILELRDSGSSSSSTVSSISISTTLTLSYWVQPTSEPKTTITAFTSPFLTSTSSPSATDGTSVASGVSNAGSNAGSVPVTHTTAFKAGIGILVAVIILAILGSIIFFIWRRRRGHVNGYVKEELRVRESMFYRPPSLRPPSLTPSEPRVVFMQPGRTFQPSVASSKTLGSNLSENESKTELRYSRSPPPNIDPNIRPYTGT